MDCGREVDMLIIALVMLSWLAVSRGGKVKVVDEPFSLAASGLSSRGDNNQAPLVARFTPERPSGPAYLVEQLHGRCFQKVLNNYLYEFCPFQNVTQREQSHRWNAFHGFLGIWKEWIVVNDTFQFMHMVHGDVCAGMLDREVKVILNCGAKEEIISVEEPSMCKYELVFDTPHACPEDVFQVYPLLSEPGRRKWDELRTRYDADELTLKGYEKKQKQLLVEEGLLLVKTDPPPKPSKPVTTALPSPEAPKTDVLSSVDRFATRAQCIEAYKLLMEEVHHLRFLLRENSTLIGTRNSTQVTYDSGWNGTGDGGAGQTFSPLERTAKVSMNSTVTPDRQTKVARARGELGDSLGDINVTVAGRRSMETSSVNREGFLARSETSSKSGQRGEVGIVDESEFPVRNLQGRLHDYQHKLMNRMKVLGRLRTHATNASVVVIPNAAESQPTV